MFEDDPEPEGVALPLTRFLFGGLLAFLMPVLGAELGLAAGSSSILVEASLLGAVLTGILFGVHLRQAWMPTAAYAGLAVFYFVIRVQGVAVEEVLRRDLESLAPLFGAWAVLGGVLALRIRRRRDDRKSEAAWKARAGRRRIAVTKADLADGAADGKLAPKRLS